MIAKIFKSLQSTSIHTGRYILKSSEFRAKPNVGTKQFSVEAETRSTFKISFHCIHIPQEYMLEAYITNHKNKLLSSESVSDFFCCFFPPYFSNLGDNATHKLPIDAWFK